MAPTSATPIDTTSFAAPARNWTRALRGATFVVSVLLVVAMEVAFTSPARFETGWWLALATVVVAVGWQWQFDITDWTQSSGRLWGLARQAWRRGVGAVLVLVGLGAWLYASWLLCQRWAAHFDQSWLMWFGAAVVMSLGFGALQTPKCPARNKLSRLEWAILGLALVIAIGFRFANLHKFPPLDGVSQIEELQGGKFAMEFLRGDRGRWEFMGPVVLHALGIWIGGPTLLATRSASAVFSALRVVPAYFWFRCMAGPTGAMVGALLLAVSGWDRIISHCSGQPDGLITLVCFALVTGPAVRGIWAVYPWIGLLVGYATTTYVVYRPLVGLALVGVAIAGLARPYDRRWVRCLAVLAPVLLVAVLAGAMFLPLIYRLSEPGRFAHEYHNGWNRAHAIEGYYGPDDTWASAVAKRWERTKVAANLYYTVGDGNPVHNSGGRPLVDAVTGGLMLLGVGYTAVRCLRGFYGLVLAAFAVTFVGTLVATGNLDVLRAQGTTTYVYALAAIGAGALFAGAQSSLNRVGVRAVLALLFGGVLWAGYWNGRLLNDLWTSTQVRLHYRHTLTYLSVWLREHARGHRVIGLIPYTASIVLQDNNEASWLRGPDIHGQSTWDVRTTLQKIRSEPEPVMFLIFSDTMIRDLIEYFEDALPGVHFQVGFNDPTDPERLAYATVNTASTVAHSESSGPALCRGLRARWDIRRADGSVIASFAEVVPFIDRTTWPSAVRRTADRNQGVAKTIDASWEGEFTALEDGSYTFLVSLYDGTLTTSVDGIGIPMGQETPIRLTAGLHRFRMHGAFGPHGMDPTAHLWWKGPGTGDQMRMVPFYRLTEPDAECVAGQPPAVATDLAAPE